MTSCSDSNENKESSSNTTTTKRKSENKSATKGSIKSKTKEVNDELFEEQLDGLKEVVSTTCASMKATYANYITPDQTSDGNDEINELATEMDEIASYIGLKMTPNRWKNFGTKDDYYENEIKDYYDQLRDYNSRMTRQAEVMRLNKLRTEATNTEVNEIIEGFDTMTNEADFGPCNIK